VVRYAFRIFAHQSSIVLGSAWAFVSAVLVVLVWVLSGPTFHFSDTWQLVINTATTVITFLMVFLIQNTQNRDTKAIHLKLVRLSAPSKAHEISLSILSICPTRSCKSSKRSFDDYEKELNAMEYVPARPNQPSRVETQLSTRTFGA
jgi:low affinity Fe/Cu permease